MITYTALFVDDSEAPSSDNKEIVELDNNKNNPASPKERFNNQNTENLDNEQAEQQINYSQAETIKEYVQAGDNFKKSITTDLMQLELTNGGTSIKEIQVIEKDGQGDYKYKGVWGRCEEGGADCVATYKENNPVKILDSKTEFKGQTYCNPCLFLEAQHTVPVRFMITDSTSVDGKIVITSFADEHSITKTTTIWKNSYIINHKFNGLPSDESVFLVWADGIEPSERTISYGVGGGISLYGADEDGDSYTTLATLSDPEALPETVWFEREWAAIWTKYFQKAITYQNMDGVKSTSFQYHAETVNENNPKYIYTTITSRHQGIASIDVDSYIGPIDPGHFEKAPHLDHLFYGKWYAMGPLKRLIIWILTSLGDLGLNYGVICILFAFLIRFFTGPLTKKSFLANQRMQALQPKIKKIQEKYKDNKQKSSQETMALYKSEGVNPLGGCLPILIQMPLLIALFQAFQNTIEFRGASLWPLSFWIPDLSQPDIFISTDLFTMIPFVGEWFFGHGISLLPILMGVTLFLNMKMSAPASSEGSPKFPMYFMNVFFVLLFNTFPAGLNLYYTAYNILNFIQQKKLKQAS